MTIETIFDVVLFPLIGILTIYTIILVKDKIKVLQEQSNSEIVDRYLGLLNNTIEQCVIATNQTYVDTLKAEGSFDAAAQKVAFQKTVDAVMAILEEDSVYYLNCIVGDLSKYIEQRIEYTINKNKGSL